MKIEIDSDIDAAYVYMGNEIVNGDVAKTIEVNSDIILDFDINGKLLGIEVLNASKNLTADFLKKAVQVRAV